MTNDYDYDNDLKETEFRYLFELNQIIKKDVNKLCYNYTLIVMLDNVLTCFKV